jgi:hypothetical protein
MTKPLYVIFVILWLLLFSAAILIIRGGEKADRDQTTPSFLSGQYLNAKRASQSTLDNIASSKIFTDLIPFRENYAPVKNLENAYHTGSLLLNSSGQETQTILNSRAKIQFF